ncbi:hypothetical protein BC940DRAFT_289854 [Gongronella butleri]|nr:hypothetical protein BC940DRAFT_289854 [Gongronella butleri]
MSSPAPIASPTPQKRRSPSTSSLEQEPPSKKQHGTSSSIYSPIIALPSPVMHPSSSDAPSASTASATAAAANSHVTYIPVYPTSHPGHFLIASPPMQQSPHQHPMSPSKILPKVDAATAPSYTLYPAYQLPPAMTSSAASSSSVAAAMASNAPLSTADQREQARKVSHSAIERRRRERINDKIMQLKQLIPTCANQGHLHKMSILQSAIEYITYLKQVLENIDQTADGAAVVRHLDAIHGKMNAVKTTKSLLPKEVEPYTSQFNASAPTSIPASSSSSSSSSISSLSSQSHPLPTKHDAQLLPTPSVSPAANFPRSPSPPKAMSVKDLLC